MTRVFLGNFVPGSVMFTSEFDFLQAAVSRVTSCGLELYSSRGELILFRFSVYFVRDDLIFRVLLTRSMISRWPITLLCPLTSMPHSCLTLLGATLLSASGRPNALSLRG
jgi:hypothetical protein